MDEQQIGEQQEVTTTSEPTEPQQTGPAQDVDDIAALRARVEAQEAEMQRQRQLQYEQTQRELDNQVYKEIEPPTPPVFTDEMGVAEMNRLNQNYAKEQNDYFNKVREADQKKLQAQAEAEAKQREQEHVKDVRSKNPEEFDRYRPFLEKYYGRQVPIEVLLDAARYNAAATKVDQTPVQQVSSSQVAEQASRQQTGSVDPVVETESDAASLALDEVYKKYDLD